MMFWIISTQREALMYYISKIKEKIRHNREEKGETKETLFTKAKNGQKKEKIYLTYFFTVFPVLSENISNINQPEYIAPSIYEIVMRIFRQVSSSLQQLSLRSRCGKNKLFPVFIWHKALDWWITLVRMFHMSLPFEMKLLGAD